MADYDWQNLPIELLKLIAERSKYLVDFMRFSVTCKRWKFAASKLKNDDKPWLSFQNHPRLLLAEDIGADLSSIRISVLEAAHEDRQLYVGRVFGDDQTGEIDRIIDHSIDYLFKNISSTRGLFSLATRKIYDLDFPEATNKVVLGANKGWLLTLGRDLEINLLHPLLREQIPLPPMLTLPSHDGYNDDFFPQKVYTMFIRKVVVSSEVPRKGALQHLDSSNLPLIMVIYGMHSILGITRLGDKLWTDVQTSERWFHDIVYHKETFYAIDSNGAIFICDIDNDDKKETQHKATQIASVPYKITGEVQCYIIESLFGSHIWAVLRFRKGVLYETGPIKSGDLWHYTSDFKIFMVEASYHNSDEVVPTCTCIQEEVKDLGNEALFIGRGSSISVDNSKFRSGSSAA